MHRVLSFGRCKYAPCFTRASTTSDALLRFAQLNSGRQLPNVTHAWLSTAKRLHVQKTIEAYVEGIGRLFLSLLAA